jgi:hypothetical protein
MQHSQRKDLMAKPEIQVADKSGGEIPLPPASTFALCLKGVA